MHGISKGIYPKLTLWERLSDENVILKSFLLKKYIYYGITETAPFLEIIICNICV